MYLDCGLLTQRFSAKCGDQRMNFDGLLCTATKGDTKHLPMMRRDALCQAHRRTARLTGDSAPQPTHSRVVLISIYKTS
jgi:hypothetical protein